MPVDKTVVIGVPRSGKTIYALSNHKPDQVIHTDTLLELAELKWGDRSQKIADWMGTRKVFCIEGCDAVRALRKFIKQNPDIRPCDHVVWLGTPRETLTRPQAAFGKGCRKIFDEIFEDLNALGILVTIDG